AAACRNCPLWILRPPTVLKPNLQGKGLSVLLEVCPTMVCPPATSAQITSFCNSRAQSYVSFGAFSSHSFFKNRLQGKGIKRHKHSPFLLPSDVGFAQTNVGLAQDQPSLTPLGLGRLRVCLPAAPALPAQQPRRWQQKLSILEP
ncbi:hypothetical protein HAX54_001678, partial [Datura stramonium]|nr:hypothetical protein [Datura stramonium]